MLILERGSDFDKILSKINNKFLLQKIIKQLTKIRNNPEIGKPMQHGRKGTKELYIKPYRLSYLYKKEENKIVLLAFYHKDKQ